MNNRVIKGNSDMRKEAGEFFAKLYNEDISRRLRVDNLNFEMIHNDNRINMEREFTEDEVKEVLMSCNGDKALGPNGFNMRFWRNFTCG